jgi:hypothetical protein
MRNPCQPNLEEIDMNKPYRFSTSRNKLEGIFAGIVFFATSLLFVGATVAELFNSGLVA